ncbi:MAG: PP2C family protein-serine/threonine phosphatase [Terriglobia bacterium]
MILERKIYDLIEEASVGKPSGSFGVQLLDKLFATFSEDLGISSCELWQRAKGEILRVKASGEVLPPEAPNWMQALSRRHKKSNPFWHPGSVLHSPVAVVTFGRKQRSFLTFYFRPEVLETDRERIEETILLITRLVTMFVQKHEERNQLHEILSLSRHQQQRLLSQSPPSFAGFEMLAHSDPSEVVGGDYYNLELLSPDVLAVTIADAKGKGFIAAVQITALHRCVRLVNHEPLKLTAKMGRLNQVFNDEGDDRDLISTVLGELHQDGRFLYVNASHPYPLLRRGHELIELDEGGLFVGLQPEAKYRFGMVEMGRGDLLCLYTDGISESESGEQDHLPQMKDLLIKDGERPLPELAESILSLTSSRENRDDRTILLIRRL